MDLILMHFNLWTVLSSILLYWNIEMNWSLLKCIKAYRSVLKRFKVFWTVLNFKNYVWLSYIEPYLNWFERHWSSLCCIDLHWTVLKCIDLVWTILNYIHWFKLYRTVLNCILHSLFWMPNGKAVYVLAKRFLMLWIMWPDKTVTHAL